MEERRGYVSHIVYRNVENGYTVFELENPDEDVEETCVGNVPFLNVRICMCEGRTCYAPDLSGAVEGDVL